MAARLLLWVCLLAAGFAAAEEPPGTAAQHQQPSDDPPGTAERAPAQPRPTMRQIAGPQAGRIPAARDITVARPVVKRRFHEAFSHTETARGAQAAAETLLAAAMTEPDVTLRWVLLDEARRLGESCGQARIVSRSFAMTAGFYDIDDIVGELRSLRQFPLRALDTLRAAALARSAEQLASRAAESRRLREAVEAEDLAMRAWQKAGNVDAARAAAVRANDLEGR